MGLITNVTKCHIFIKFHYAWATGGYRGPSAMHYENDNCNVFWWPPFTQTVWSVRFAEPLRTEPPAVLNVLTVRRTQMIIQHVIGADRGFNYGCHCSWWPTTRTVPVPKYILNHLGFISAIRADSTGYYEQNKESVYTTMLAMCGTQEMLQTFLDGISNDYVDRRKRELRQVF